MASQEPLLHSEDEEDLVFDRTGLLHPKHKSGITLTDLRNKGSRFHIARTVNLCFSFFALGLCFALPTATLEDLRKAVSADSWSIEYIYTARYSGYVLGALIGGVLFDRYNRQFLLFLSLLCTGVGVVVMPFCNALGTLMACTAVTGLTMGFLDTGGNVWCLDLWGKSSAPVMQALHFFFALGAFVAPLVAEPFLSPNISVEPLVNHSLYHSNTSEIKFPPKIVFPHGSPHSGPPFQERTRRDLNSSYFSLPSSLTTPDYFSTPSSSKPKKPAFADGNLLHHDTTWERQSLHKATNKLSPTIEVSPAPIAAIPQNYSNYKMNSTKYFNGGQTIPPATLNVSTKVILPNPEPLASATSSSTNLDSKKEEVTSATIISTTYKALVTQGDHSSTAFTTNNDLNKTKVQAFMVTSDNVSSVDSLNQKVTLSSVPTIDPFNQKVVTNDLVENTTINVLSARPEIIISTLKPTAESETLVYEMTLNKSTEPSSEENKDTSTEAPVTLNNNNVSELLNSTPPNTIASEDVEDIEANPPPLNEQNNEESADEIEASATKKSENNTEASQDFLGQFFDTMHQKRLGRFEFAYVILSVYLFVLAIVFLIFLCLNPRESRSRQEEELDKTHFVTSSFKISLVGLMSLFFCLYVGIQVSVGQLLQTFVTKQQVEPSRPTGYFLTYMFWGSFAMSRGFAVGLATRVSNVTILVANLTVCLLASIMLVAGANKVEGLLWAGIVVLAVGMAPVFPAALSWVEHYLPVTNKIASLFILGAALGEMALPLLIERSMTRDPMILMYVNIGVNALCFVTFGALWLLASRQGSKYKQKPSRTLYQLASAADELDDSLELNNHRWFTDEPNSLQKRVNIKIN